MSEERVEPKPIDLGEYKFGFHDDVEPVLSTGKGLNEAVIRELSAARMNQSGCWISASNPTRLSRRCRCRLGGRICQRLTLMT